MSLKEHTGEAVVHRVQRLNERIGLPARLSEAGVTAEHIDTLTNLAVDDFAHPNNPKPVTRDDFHRLYTEAL